MKKNISVLILFMTFMVAPAQVQKNADPDKKTDWWGDIDGFINQQAKVTLTMAGEVLKTNPPSIQESQSRKMALLLIDNVLHEEKAPYRPAVQDFFKSRISDAVKEISGTKVDKGAVIWKLYNHTFVVKTSSVTIGFDIQRGMTSIPGFTLEKELITELADAVDILFISHTHNDHNEELVAEIFTSRNKPVVSPEGIYSGSDLYNKIRHPARSASSFYDISLPHKNITLRTVVFPGHQGATLENNVYLVFTPEGLSFAHTGDQSNQGDFDWIDKAGKNHRIDVLMTNSWSYYPDMRTAKGYDPELIIAAHENELGHTIDHREPYWLNPVRLGDGKTYPWIQMAWGEKFNYTRPAYTSRNAHSHNDYLRNRPFYEAYENRFGSIEADIWAVEGELMVAHARNEIKPGLTIDSLYIQPIAKIVRANKGLPWSGRTETFQLLIDLKTGTESTLPLLASKICSYPDVFDPAVNREAVKIVITGNRPEPAKFNGYPAFISFDGIIGKEYSEDQLKRVALFSENLRRYTSWQGKGEMNERDRLRLQTVIDSIHSLNKKVRFWNAPDNMEAWEYLMKMKVDFINTDNIPGLSSWLSGIEKQGN